MLYKVVLTFTPLDETLVCYHSNESLRAVFELFFCKKIPLSRRVEYVMGRG